MLLPVAVKPFFTLSIFLITVTCVTIFFVIRATSIHTELDLLQHSLVPLQRIIPAKDLIFLKLHPYNPTLFTQTEYAIVPNVISIKDSVNSNWTLHISVKKEISAEQRPDTFGTSVAWRAADSLYEYVLARKTPVHE